MVLPVERDARGIVDPNGGLRRFQLDRHAPSAPLDRFVDRYWIVTWNLAGQEPYTQAVFAHPVVNVVFSDDRTLVNGVTTKLTYRTLTGAGMALGVMFRPAGFRPFLGRPMTTITDRAFDAAEVFGAPTAAFEEAVRSASGPEALVAAAHDLLAPLVPPEPQPSELTTALVEAAATDRSLVRVDQLADIAHQSVRQLERRFADHVGVGPKMVLRRYRIYEAAERARHGGDIEWAELAARLGYSDQAHLTRDFTAAIGMPPERYARLSRS